MIVSALEKLQVRQQIPDNFRQNTKDTQILFHIRRTTTNMEMTMILTIVVLNILLPSADVVTDMNLVVRLYKAPPGYVCYYNHEMSYNDGLIMGGKYEKCVQDPVTFCSNEENRQKCIASHYKIATVLLMPFLLNYAVSFYTFFRLTTTRKKFLFIFPLLNLYPQYGKTHSS